MPNFRRYYIPNAIVFITGVTRGRVPYLEPKDNIELLWETMRRVQEIHPFHLLAFVILPDHFHWLMRVDGESGNFSTVLHSIKRNYTLNFKKAHGITTSFNLWQERFWDHVIRGERDLNNPLTISIGTRSSTVTSIGRRTGHILRISIGWSGGITS